MDEEDGAPYRALAARVLMLAIRDAHGVVVRAGGKTRAASARRAASIKAEALGFLDPDNPVLAAYCDGLDFDPEAFCDAARTNGSRWAADPASASGLRAE